MSVSSSGAITTTGNVAGTASYATNADLLDGLDSTVFTLTSSFAAQTASFTAFTASVNSFTASQLVLNGTYATTGSNTFAGIQTVNSNLIVTGSITAQTLVVQTITSSVDFVTGSTRFGSLSSNTHVFTGSLSASGSTHSIFGNVVVGNNSSINASAKLEVKGDLFLTPSSSIASIIHLYNKDSTNETYIYDSGSSSNSYLTFAPGGTTRMTINSSGNVLIGTTTDSGFGKLQITGLININTSDTTAASTSQQAYDYSRLRIKATNGSNLGLSMGYSGGNYNYIQSCYNEGTTAPMMLNPFGGSVVVGSNVPNGSQLQVNGTIDSQTGIFLGTITATIAALNTSVLLFAGAVSGIITLRDNTNGGSIAWLQDPNGGNTVIANNLTNGTIICFYSGGNTYIQKTAGNVPITVQYVGLIQ